MDICFNTKINNNIKYNKAEAEKLKLIEYAININFMIMAEIIIDPTKNTISVEVESQSIHALGFDITVYDADDNFLEDLEGSTEDEPVWKKPLKLKPSESKGKYINGIFNFKSPDGTDYDYKAIFSLLLDDVKITPVITLIGKTNKGNATTISDFQIS